MMGRHIVRCVHWSIENIMRQFQNVKIADILKRNSQSWQQCYRFGNGMGAYELPQAAKYSTLSGCFREEN